MRAEDNNIILNEWLAGIITADKDHVISLWIDNIRKSGRQYYLSLSDAELHELLLPTLLQMIRSLYTGGGEVVRDYVYKLVSDRIRRGVTLGDVEQALHDLRVAVMTVVREQTPSLKREMQSLETIYNLHDQVALITADAYQVLQQEQRERFLSVYNLGVSLSRSLELLTVMHTAVDYVKDKAGVHFVTIAPSAVYGEQPPMVFAGAISPELHAQVPEICHALKCGPDAAEPDNSHVVPCVIADTAVSKELLPWRSMLISCGCLSMACMALLDKGRFLGSLLICFSVPHSFSDYETDFLLAMGSHIAASMHNAMLYEEARGKKELRLLLDASKLFSSTLELNKVLQHFAKLAVRMMGADLSFIFMPEEAGMVLHVRATYAHPGYAKTLLAKICKVWEPAGIPRGKGAIGVTYERGKPLLIGRYGSYPARIRELEKMIGSFLVYPLKSRGRMLGVLGLASAQESAFSEEHLNTVYGLANQAAVAIDNAELFERQRNIADTLQKSFLPAHAPDIPGFEFAARYRAALQEAEVGGDFYDAFQLRDGRFAVLVADVSGKGLSAAVNTAMGKYIIRAYASENPSPSNVLGRANRALERYLSIGMFITTFYGVLDPADGSFTYASAGHDPPMYYSFGKGYVSSLDVTGPGLGSIADVEYGERMITFGPGDTLFMYTDGATDIRRRSQMLGWEGLLNLYNGAIGKSADEVAEYVFQGVLKYGDNHLSDDIAMIVLKRKV